MPGPAHSGGLYFEQWRPGAGVAGQNQSETFGGFSNDMVLVGVYRDSGATGSANSIAKLQIQQAVGLALYSVFENFLTNSDVFDGDLAGGRHEMGIVVPAGAKVKLTVTHLATDDIKWLFVWSKSAAAELDMILATPEKPGLAVGK